MELIGKDLEDLCASSAYVAMIKYPGKNQLGKERDFFSLQFQIAVHYCTEVNVAGT